MRLSDLKQFERFRGDRLVKVLRHRDTTKDLWALSHAGRFQRFQNGQSWDVFGKAHYVISFIAERHRYARFVGAWEVLATYRNAKNGVRSRTRELPGFDDLKGRLVVSWGEGTRSWAQWMHRQGDKKIIELLPPDYVMEFPGFYDFTLPFEQLAQIVSNPDSHREWQRMLSSVSGVYLILDRRAGRQYVGSAYGSGGIWARWRTYAKSPSGGNKLLKDQLARRPSAFKNFEFSILRVLEPSSTRDGVLMQERLVKLKLGSRAFGLNSN